MYKKGFTLIELLVVISIIALLSSVVLSSLSAARLRARDTSVKSAMKQIHIQAQNYLDTNLVSSFPTANTCTNPSWFFTNAKMKEILDSVTLNSAGSLACGSLINNWAVSVNLKGGGTWCTDNNQGWFRAGTANTATGQCQ